MRSRLNKKDISPRTSPNMRGAGPDVAPESGVNIKDGGKYPYPHAMGANGLLLQVPAGYGGVLPGGSRHPVNHGGAAGVNVPPTGAGQTPVSSQTRQSISRKSLREIPADDVRLSQVRAMHDDFFRILFDAIENVQNKHCDILEEIIYACSHQLYRYVNLLQTQKPYNVAKYQMEDLSESFETKMLQELKEQALQVIPLNRFWKQLMFCKKHLKIYTLKTS